VDRAPSLDDLRAHRLHLLAAWRWRRLGRPVPAELVDEERFGATFAMAVQSVLERARSAVEGPIVVCKGPVLAALYPDPALRHFRDLDLLVPDADAAQAALLGAGFQPVANDDSYYAGRHHLRPLVWPRLPLVVEVHRRPQWPTWSQPPSTEEVIAAAEPADVGVEGVLAPVPAQHALLVAAHSWAESPLRRALDLVDVAALVSGVDRSQVRQLAREWDINGVWDTTTAAMDALLYEGRVPLSMKLWARDLHGVRDRTVIENHFRRVVGSFWALPPHRAARVAFGRVLDAMRPEVGESWRQKLSRSALALRHPFTRLSDHHSDLERVKDRAQ
jgi:Uncharacterised nucleotidyltransferase